MGRQSTFDRSERRREDRRGKKNAKPAVLTPRDLEIVHPDAAGIDIGSRTNYVAVPPARDTEHVRAFGTTTPQLHALADWLQQCAIRHVAMEATGVYWIPLYEILEERGFVVCLANPHEAKSKPGRKSDVLDCQWLLQLHTFGLLNASFRPKDVIVELRSYMRLRTTHVRQQSDEIRRMQKALHLMNLQLHNVLSDVTGTTGMQIIRAIVAGERDPKKLAANRDYRCHASSEEIEAALTGNYRPDHLLSLTHSLKLWDHLQTLIQECDQAAQDLLARTIQSRGDCAPEIEVATKKRGGKPTTKAPFASQLTTLTSVNIAAIPGFDNLSACKLISEIGMDMSPWPDAHHFVAWLRLAPGSSITGGRVLRSRKGQPSRSRAAEILRQAAVNTRSTQTWIGGFYRRMKARKDSGVAVAATAAKLARILYRLLKTGEQYIERGIDAFEAAGRDRSLKYLQKKAKRLGFALVELPKAAPAAA